MLTFVYHCDLIIILFPIVQLGEHGNLLSSQTPLYQFAHPAVPLVQPQASASYSTVSTHLTPPEMTTFPHPQIIARTGMSLVAELTHGYPICGPTCIQTLSIFQSC